MKLLLAAETTMRSGEGEERPRTKKKKKSEGKKLPLSVGHQSEHPSESITEIRKRKEGARSRLRNTLSQCTGSARWNAWDNLQLNWRFLIQTNQEGHGYIAGNTLSQLLHSALEVLPCRVCPVIEEEEEELGGAWDVDFNCRVKYSQSTSNEPWIRLLNLQNIGLLWFDLVYFVCERTWSCLEREKKRETFLNNYI